MMNTILRYIFSFTLLFVAAHGASAFSLDTYAPSSVLAEGRWVKVSVSRSGPHCISAATLRSWGFSDISSVRIFGYGGARIPDLLSADNYVDDLPSVRFELTDAGIVFFAQGPDTWTIDLSGRHTHTLNPYSERGYYFITDSRADVDYSIPVEGSAPRDDAATSYTERGYHELDAVSATESGHQLLGEDFRYTPSRIFNFSLPGKVENTPVWMQCDFFASSTSSPTRLSFTANGDALPALPGDRVRATGEWADTCRIRKTFDISGSTLALGISASYSGPVKSSYLDKIDINYTRELAVPSSGSIDFDTEEHSLLLAGAGTATRVWDVTDAVRPIAMSLSAASNGTLGWTSDRIGRRRYAVWNGTGSSLPSPSLVGTVQNQNIHALGVPDMVIVTPSQLLEQSRRVAELHEKVDSMTVHVLLDTQVYNEFGSGCADAGAIRRMLKMFYDRGNAADAPRHLANVLLMGGVTHDHRYLTEALAGRRTVTLPVWQTDISHNESNSYPTDDFFAMLDDDSGIRFATDVMNIGVGRIPAKNVASAKTYVDRLVNYVTKPESGEWRNSLLLFADNGNDGDHVKQTDAMEQAMRTSLSGSGFTFNKVYIDAYDRQNGTSQEAKAKVETLLSDGVVIWSYIGHASINLLSGDGIFTPTYLTNLYLRRPTFLYAACCSFGQLDGVTPSGMEQLVLTDAGGLVGGFTATRPSIIVRNGELSKAFGEIVFERDLSGRFKTLGDVFRLTKNKTGGDNKRLYTLFCDPALRLSSPENYVRITSINGEPVDSVSQPVIPALGKAVVRGEICDPLGAKLESFSGTLSLSLYDAERSFTTKGSGDGEAQLVFDEQGERLYAGRTAVAAGEFEVTIAMPAEISDNYRNATLSMYAKADDGTEASGVTRDLYVYGFDENAAPDSTPPVIEYLYLNHETFSPEEAVNADPMLIARVSDDVAINMSGHGVGHQMSIRIDDDINLTDVGSRYVPDSDGSPAGIIRYQLPTLSAGNHKATLRVWDTAGNSASSSLDFFVNPDAAPKIFDVYSDANPASVEANFYVSHNRPDAMLTVKIEVYDISGRLVWTSESHGRADMYSSSPVTWNLTDRSGSRVGRGIYLYKTTVMSGGRPSVLTKRIAVAPI